MNTLINRKIFMGKPIMGLILTLGIACFMSACQTTPAQEGAMWGGAVGAVAGQLIGGDTEATLIGAGAGALGGALLNDTMKSGQQKAREEGYNQGYNAGASQTAPSGYTTIQQPQYNTSPR